MPRPLPMNPIVNMKVQNFNSKINFSINSLFTNIIPEVARKLVVVESELERAEKRIDDLSFENKKLKDEIRTYSNELKSFEAADEQYTERETQVNWRKF